MKFLQLNSFVQAFVKNIQKYVVYCSLNVGASGVILDDESLANIKLDKKSIGEIIMVQVSGFDKSGRVILKYSERPFNNKAFAPQAFDLKDLENEENLKGLKVQNITGP